MSLIDMMQQRADASAELQATAPPHAADICQKVLLAAAVLVADCLIAAILIFHHSVPGI